MPDRLPRLRVFALLSPFIIVRAFEETSFSILVFDIVILLGLSPQSLPTFSFPEACPLSISSFFVL